MSKKTLDMTQPPELSDQKGTGPVPQQRPKYIDFLPPCNNACPTGSNIQEWLSLAQEGKIEAAWRALCKNNPMPAIHGRVCYHPCENACNRAMVDDSVSIHSVERYLGDKAIEEKWDFKIEAEPSGKRILVVGAGPSGMAVSYHLAMMGHEVEVREAGPFAGGMMHFGIPSYRLPRDILKGEADRIARMGVKFTFNHKVTDVLKEKEEGNFDAVFMAIGAHIGKHIDIPARDAGKILDAVTFLRDVDRGDAPKIGRRVAIYGGGNTAMDAARVAKRLGGVDEAMIIYRRDYANMPAHQFEADEAAEEDVKFHWLRTIQSIEGGEIKVEVMEIGEDGRPKPTGEIETIAADSLILALGQDIETDLLQKIPGVEFDWDGTTQVNDQMMTGAHGIFAGGDMVPSDRTVTIATGHGKKAARHIDAWLRGGRYVKGEKHPLIGHENLHLWYKTDADQSKHPVLPPEERGGFVEVVGGLTEEQAVYEASRCYSCGNCFECDGCYGACPEGAIIKLGKGNRYRFDYDLCTGCQACYNQCPCHAIDMLPGSSVSN